MFGFNPQQQQLGGLNSFMQNFSPPNGQQFSAPQQYAGSMQPQSTPMNPMSLLPRNTLSQLSGMPQRQPGGMIMPQGMMPVVPQQQTLGSIINFILRNQF